MNGNKTEQLICIAAIAGAFGVKGEVRIKSFTDDPAACLTYGPLMNETGEIVLTPLKSRPVKGGFAITTKEVKTREQAESLKSTKLYIRRSSLPDADEDEFYYSDLIGMTVETADGDKKGRIKAIHDFGSGDVLEIQTPGKKDWYHPFTKDAVPVVDVKSGKVIIEIIEPEEVRPSAETD